MPSPITDQHDVVAFLATPAAYGPECERVDRIDTHISVVFLARDRAYKLKRDVHFPYIDYSTLEARRQFCDKEVRSIGGRRRICIAGSYPLRTTDASDATVDVLHQQQKRVSIPDDWRRVDTSASLDRVVETALRIARDGIQPVRTG